MRTQNYIQCSDCGVNLNSRNIERHKKKCKAKNRTKNIAKSVNKKGVNRSKENDDLSLDDRSEERRLDGSRDYWRYRESGKFGSHSVFDDMNDESDP